MNTNLLMLLRRIGLWSLALLVAGVFTYYIVFGLLFYQKINDDPQFTASEITQGGSGAVDIAAALITREVDTHSWVANDPWFVPSVWLTRTPAYQQGIIYALSRFAVAMGDQLARQRGSSAIDPDLDQAAGYLKYAGDVWVFNFKTSILPTATSEQQYRSARKALLAYNQRLAAGKASYERRADNFQMVLESIVADLGSLSAAIDEHVREKGGGILEFDSNRVFFATKGRLYGYYLLLREIGKDFEPVLKEKGMESVWANTLASLKEAALLNPLIIFNGRGDSQFMPCHLCNQGFWLLRARTQLREASNILIK